MSHGAATWSLRARVASGALAAGMCWLGSLAGGCGHAGNEASGAGARGSTSSGQAGGASASGGGDAASGGAGPSTGSASGGGGGDPGVVSFAGSWDVDPAEGRFHEIQVVTPTKLQKDPSTPTWHALGAARVEVDQGDDPLNLGEDTERAEVLVMQDASMTPIPEDASSGLQYFALSYRFPSDWSGTQIPGDSNSWSIVFQLHGPDSLGASPAIALSAAKQSTSGVEKYRIDTNGGDVSMQGCCGPSFDFSDGGAIALGSWTDFVFAIRFASTKAGSIDVFRRDQGQTKFSQVLSAKNVATLQYSGSSPVGEHYWKQGLYRGGVDRTDVLWIGPTVRATSFAAAEKAAFGTSSGMP